MRCWSAWEWRTRRTAFPTISRAANVSGSRSPRAVVGDRRLLLADEPTGALDSANGEAVMRLLRARAVARFPVAVRLPMRDLARHQARSGVALAAVSLTLGIPAAIVVTSTAAEASRPPGWTSRAHHPQAWRAAPG